LSFGDFAKVQAIHEFKFLEIVNSLLVSPKPIHTLGEWLALC
jgi:hypothetical protein